MKAFLVNGSYKEQQSLINIYSEISSCISIVVGIKSIIFLEILIFFFFILLLLPYGI